MTMKLVVYLVALLAVVASTVAAQTPDVEETAIIRVLDDLLKAVKSGDIKLLLAQYADDAQIDSRAAGGRVGKEKFGESVQAMFKQGTITGAEHHGRKVTLIDATHASVLGTSDIITKAGRSSQRVEWRMEKRGGRWVVVELNAVR